MMLKPFLFLFLFLPACSTPQTPLYEREYATPGQAEAWAKRAPLKELCLGTKNWRPDTIKEAALREIKERGLDTRECYYTGMELTP